MVQQPQFAQPQFAQMVIGGQVQQVQVLGGMPQQPQPAQQIITLPNGQQAIVAGAAAAAAAPQIMQMPQTVQQMALVPVSGPNGQTVYQQVPVPVQVAAPAQTTALVPVAVQTSSGQQIIMQQVCSGC